MPFFCTTPNFNFWNRTSRILLHLKSTLMVVLLNIQQMHTPQLSLYHKFVGDSLTKWQVAPKYYVEVQRVFYECNNINILIVVNRANRAPCVIKNSYIYYRIHYFLQGVFEIFFSKQWNYRTFPLNPYHWC